MRVSHAQSCGGTCSLVLLSPEAHLLLFIAQCFCIVFMIVIVCLSVLSALASGISTLTLAHPPSDPTIVLHVVGAW